MKNIVKFFSLLILSTAFLPMNAQDQAQLKVQEIGVHLRWRFSQMKDSRLSAQTFHLSTPSFGTIYRKETSQKREALIFTYASTRTSDPKGLLKLKLINPQVRYSHQRKVGNLWVGGFIDHFSLMRFPNGPAGIFNNNPISYTISNSIGPMISSDFTLSESGDNRISAVPALQMGLLNYVIRPSYGHPYPDAYLTEEHFSPTRSGMAGPLLRSGKFKLPHKYQMFRFTLGLFFQIRGRYKLGLDYEMYFQRDTGLHPSSTLNHDLGLSATYLY